MLKYKVLALTDHSKHSSENSLYALMRNLVVNERCEYVDIASRGIAKNYGFFNNMDKESLHAIRINESFDFEETGEQFSNNVNHINLLDYDIILMRLPRPISDEFLDWLERIVNKGIFINKPSGIITTSNKSFLLNFPDLCPPIKYCKSISEILQFASRFPIVLKPLREYGGKGIIKINGDEIDDGNNIFSTVSYLETIRSQIENSGYLAMKFMKNVDKGDKRIIVVGGEIMAASLRLPPKDSWLCNVAQGGRSVETKVENEEINIIKGIDPLLNEAGILIYGVDTLVNDIGERVLSEINTLSIGGFPQAQVQSGKPIIKMTIEKIINYAQERIN